MDLTRKDRGIDSRLPQSISSMGYDLRKKTGKQDNTGEKFAGVFKYVGVGNTLNDWLSWSDEPDISKVITNLVPKVIRENLLSNDEGAIFSVIDYLDLLSLLLEEDPHSILKVQNPMKWQPNEIDGLYFSQLRNTLYPCEAKSLSGDDQINLVQMRGGYNTIQKKLSTYKIQSLAVIMIPNGLDIGVMEPDPNDVDLMKRSKHIRVKFDPVMKTWG